MSNTYSISLKLITFNIKGINAKFSYEYVRISMELSHLPFKIEVTVLLLYDYNQIFTMEHNWNF